jgi:hypothetical protein
MNQHIAMIGVTGAGKCVSGSTLVVDPETGDLVRIDQVVRKKEGKVLTLDADLKLTVEKPVAYYESGVQDVYELRTRLGKRIRATAEHPLLTISGWKACKDLKKGDRIAVPRAIPVFGNEDMPDDQVKALAYMLTDGCAPNSKHSHEKEIPPVVFRLKKEKLALFLNQLFAYDGWATLGREVDIGYSSSSEKKAAQIQHLLLRFGIVAKLEERKTEERPTFSVEIQNLDMIKKFLKEIIDLGRKEAIGEELCAQASDILWDEVVSVVYAGKEPTYDLSVNPTHNFVANDIIVHNSYSAKLILTRLAERDPDLAFFIVDPENEYARTALAIDLTAKVVHVGRGVELGLDPFALFPESKDMILDILVELLGVSGEPGLLSELRVAVQESSSLQDLAKRVRGELRKRLDGLLRGPEGFLFRGKPLEIGDRMVFSFKELHEALRISGQRTGTLHLASLLIFGKIWKKIEEMPRERLKVVIVDEVWLYSAVPASASFLNYVSRRGRKRNVMFVLCSQRPEDVLGVEDTKAAIQNCATKIILSQDEASLNLVREAFGLTEREAEGCTDFSPGEAILLSRGIRVPLLFRCSPLEHLRFTTKPGEAL